VLAQNTRDEDSATLKQRSGARGAEVGVRARTSLFCGERKKALNNLKLRRWGNFLVAVRPQTLRNVKVADFAVEFQDGGV
jgi:hypothetical protein